MPKAARRPAATPAKAAKRAARPAHPVSAVPAPGPNRAFAEVRLPPSAVVDRARVTVNLNESPLGWLVRRGMVTQRQFEAGERLRADYERAQLAPSVTMRWDAAPTAKTARGAPAGLDPTSSQLAAKQRFAVAIDLVGAGLSDVLWRVVCANEGIAGAERALGWPARSGKVVLGLALDRLADAYQLR